MAESVDVVRERMMKRNELPPELEKMDIMDLLDKLSPEELEELNTDFDPDNSMLPPSERVRNQTEKAPTGKFDRRQLIKFLEDKAKKEKDWEQNKPYVKETKGKVWQAPEPAKESGMHEELGMDATEFDDALAKCTEEELVDLAAVLGFHGMLNQVQYNASMVNEKVEGGWHSVAKAQDFAPVQSLPPNDTDPVKALKELQANDAKLKVLNLNNMKSLSISELCEFGAALKGNTELEELHMANTGATDKVCKAVSKGLEGNSGLRVLNMESNFITGLAIVDLFKAVNKQGHVREIKLENQRPSVMGVRNEALLCQLLEQNTSLTSLSLNLESMEGRVRSRERIQRNLDAATRQERTEN